MDDDTNLKYVDSCGTPSELDCDIYQDKQGKWWLWSNQLNRNLAYKAKTKEYLFLAAIGGLLHSVALRDKEIARLRKIEEAANKFAEILANDKD